MVMHEELPPRAPPRLGTLPFDDSIPSRSELRTRGFFKTLEKARRAAGVVDCGGYVWVNYNDLTGKHWLIREIIPKCP